MRLFKNKFWMYAFALFGFTLLFSLLIPMGGDDFGMYLHKGITLSEIFELSKWFYSVWEGRFFARVFSLLLIPNEILWAFVNASLMTLIFYFMYKIIGVKEKYLPFILMGLLFIDYETFAQVYVWRTGNIFYFLPIVFAFALVFIRRNVIWDADVNIRWWNYLFVPFTLIFCMFVENVAVGIIIICLLNLIFYYFKYKKIDKPMLLCFVSAIIGFCLMYFSPGTQIRVDMESAFTSLSIFEKFIHNIPNLINYTFIKNSFIVFLFILVMSIIVWRNIKNKKIKFLLLIFIVLPSGITAFLNIISPFVMLPNVLLKVLNHENLFIDIYWILFTLLFLFLIIYYLKIDKSIYYFLILAFLSAGSMMFSPTWGGRTACFTTFMLFISLFLIIMKLNLRIFESGKIFVFSNLICIVFMLLFTIYSVYIYDLNIDRIKYINYQRENNAKEYEIIILPGYYTWNLNTWGSEGEFADNFRRVFGIADGMQLIYVNRKDVQVDIDKLDVSSKLGG